MKGVILILLSLLLSGCAIEQEKVDNDMPINGIRDQEEIITGTFMLQAEPGYISADNEKDAEVYIIDTDNNEVYVSGKGRSYTVEELERFEEMTPEEIDEFIGSEEAEDPLHDIKSLDATRDSIILEYEDEKVEFTALSKSFFETDSGVRYRLEENTSISAYEESRRSE